MARRGDAESLLDLVLANGGPITMAAVEAALGGAPFELRMAILDAIAASDVAGVLTGVAALLDEAHDPRRIAEGLLAALRDTFITVASGGRVEIDEPAEVQARLRAVGEGMGNAALVRSLETLGQAIVDMRTTDAADPRLVLEIALVRLARRESAGALANLADRVDRLEARLADGTTTAPAGPEPGSAPTRRRSRPSGSTSAPEPPPPSASDRPTDPAPEPTADAPDPAAGRSGPPPALGALRRQAGTRVVDAPPEKVAPLASAPTPVPDSDTTFDLDDVIVAWAVVLDALPRSLRASIQEAQPVAVDGNVVVFGVARTHLDAVRPKFQKNADAIRDVFIAELGAPPRFKFTPHEWGEGEGPPHRLVVVPDPEPPPPEDEAIDLVDPEELVDAPADAGVAVDSLSRLTDTFGATVVEEQPKS